MALTEAISHLNRGLELVSTLPWSSQRDASELELRRRLGNTWIALKGWAATESRTIFHPALALARSLQRHDAVLQVLAGLASNIMAQGRAAESLPWTQEMLDVAKASDDPTLLIVAHNVAGVSCTLIGEFTKGFEHADRVLHLYNEEGRHPLTSTDAKTTAGAYASICAWMLGYRDRAFRLEIERTPAGGVTPSTSDMHWRWGRIGSIIAGRSMTS
jgi:hypothetical protein